MTGAVAIELTALLTFAHSNLRAHGSCPRLTAPGFGVSPSAARALPCRAARAGASAPAVDGRLSLRSCASTWTRYGVAPDGRLFPALTTGGRVRESVYTRTWKQARARIQDLLDGEA
ncbi:hypothetical protein GCM10023204_17380 [Actinomycetospora succinea]